MFSQNDYDKLLNDYSNLQLRVTRFSYIEQQLINTRDELDRELLLYKRLNKFNKEALKDMAEVEFVELVSDSIIDIFEIEVSGFSINYHEANRTPFIHVEGKSFEESFKNELQLDIKSIADKSTESTAEILPARILKKHKSLNLFSDVIVFSFKELELGYTITLFGLVSKKSAPLYQKLNSKQEAIFTVFGLQVQSLLANRKRGEKIKEQINKISNSELELKKLSLIATKTKNGVIISDTKGRVEWVNESFTKSTGYQLEEVVGKKPKEFLQRSNVDLEVQEKLSNALSKKESIEVKILNYTKNGDPYFNQIEIIPVFDDEGNHINFVSVQKDITAETLYQEEILRMNSRFELIANISNIGIWEWNEKLNKAVWNDVLVAQYGADRDFIGDDFKSFWQNSIYEEDLESTLQGIERVRNGAVKFIEQEFRIVRHHDKAIRILKCLTIAERDYDGNLFRMVGSTIDITEEREAGQKLIASEQKYRSIIENMSLGLVEVDLDQNVVYNNKKFNELTLLKNASTLTIANNGLKSLEEKVSHKIIKSFKKMDEAVYEIEYERKDKMLLNLLVSAAPIYNLKNQITGYINIYLDITSVKALQNNLELALVERDDSFSKVNSLKFFYESILNHSPAKIAVFNSDLTLAYANELLLSKDKYWKESYGKNLFQIAAANPREEESIISILNNINNSISSKSLVQFEQTSYNEEGKSKDFLMSALPYFNSKNELQHVIVSGVNITDLKLIQNDVLYKNSELNKINGELDNFVYRVSHDLRAPLLSIKGILNLLFQTEIFNDNVKEYLNLIQNSVLRLDDTIQEILEYSRNARLELKLEHFDVAELTQIICEDLRFTASNEIDFNISNTGSTFLVTDKSRLNTVLKNIISNSVKYKKVNSKDCYINISLSSIGNSMIITITDNGIGIHPNSIPKIFEMFYRGTSTSVGTGLGLYIAKEILSKLKASINVSSEIGIGTTITINIPNLTNITDDKIFIN